MIMIVTGHDRWVWLVVMMDVAMWGLDSRCGYMVGVAVVLGGHDRWVWQLCCKALFCCVVSSPFLVFLCFIL